MEYENKYFFQIFSVGDGYTYFERGCAVHGEVSRREGRNCIERVGTYKTRMWYCICDNKDGCNSAPSLSTGSISMKVFAVLFALHLATKLNFEGC